MGTGYTRNDTANNIADGNIINASDLDGEFDAVEAAFNSSTGHTHDGTSAEGGAILVLGPSQEFVASATEVKPSTNAGLNLGTNLLQFNNLWLDGTANIDSLVADTADINGGTIDGATIGASSAAAITGTTITGTSFVSSGNMTFGDNDKAIFGAGSDLQIYHDGSGSFVDDQGTGGLILRGTNLFLRSSANENYLGAVADGSVTIYHDNAPKLETTSTGIDVTGNATFADNGKAIFGAGSDLQIYHDGSNSYIDENGVGNLFIRSVNGASARIYSGGTASSNLRLLANSGGEITLYHSGSAKLSTTSTGIDVTGTVTADGLNVDGDATSDSLTVSRIGDSSTALITINTDATAHGMFRFQEASSDVWRIVKEPTDELVIDSGAGEIRARFDTNGDISFYEDTGTTAKFFWDASAESLGIGTSSPGRTLEVYSSQPAIKLNNGTNAFTIGTGAFVDGSNSLVFFDEGVGERMRITSGGTLQIAGGGNDNVGEINMGNTAQNANRFQVRHQSSAWILKTVDSEPLLFGTANSERMRIDSSGNVGIGTSSIAAKLHIESASGSITPSVHADELLVEGSGNSGITIGSGISSQGSIRFADSGGDSRGQVNYDHSADSLRFYTADSLAATIDSSGNVGIGTSSPSALLHLESAGPSIKLVDNDNNPDYEIKNGNGSFRIIDTTAGSDRINIDSSGNLLVGKTSANTGSLGAEFRPDGLGVFGRSSDYPLILNRTTSDGGILLFRKDGTTVGSIGYSGDLYIDPLGTNDALRIVGHIAPWTDNTYDVGLSSRRWDDIYATNGTIQTSDRNEKQDIAELDEAERRVAVAAKGLLRKFRWKDAVAEKGDEARTHFGIIAQDLQAAFAAEGLDAGDYAMFIHTTWTDEETGEERSRMGVRYSELLAFIIAAI